MSAISATLLWCAIQTTLLAMLTLLLSARPWRIGGSTAPLFGLVGVFLITGLAFLPIPWCWDLRWFDRPNAVASLPPQTSSAMASSEGATPVTNHAHAPTSEAMQIDSTFVDGFLEQLRNATEASDSQWSLSPVSAIVLGLFAIGFTIGSLRFLIGLVATRRLVRASRPIQDQRLDEAAIVLCAKLALKQSVGIYETSSLSTAATLGVRQPIILLPTHWRKWTDAELNAVLAHELAHIAHGDFAAVLISQLSIVIHFYHPLVHWLSHRLRLEQELAADSVAAQIAGGQVRYLRVLAKLALEHQDRFVGWPARAFLPTRHTFLRRLEMLRDVQLNPSGRVSVGSWFAMTAIGLASIALVGMKPPQSPAMAQEPVAKVPSKPLSNAVQYDLRYFSDEGGLVIAAKPAELLSSSVLSGAAKQIQDLPQVQSMLAPFKVELKDIDQVLMAIGNANQPSSICVRSSKPMSDLKTLQTTLPGGKPMTLAGTEVLSVALGEVCIWKPDDRTIVLGTKRNVERWIQGRQLDLKLANSEIWAKLKDRPLLAICEGQVARNWLRGTQSATGPGSMLTSSFAPIVDEAEVLGVAASTDNAWSLTALAKSTDSKGAAIILETSQAGLVLIKNGLREIERTIQSQPAQPGTNDSKRTMEVLLTAGIKLAEGAMFQADSASGTVSLKTSIKSEEIPVASITSAILQTRKAAERSQSANNLKQIGIAFHNFESTYRQFPGTSKSPDPNQKHPVSWRVMILPYIEQAELYQAYRFDEPWDGPNNIKLLAKMPKIYKHPDSAQDSTETNYAVLVSEEERFSHLPKR